MTFDPFKPGNYVEGERLLHTEANQINEDIPYALDGRDGGSYTPSAAIQIGGSGIECSVAPSTGNDVVNKTALDAAVASAIANAENLSASYEVSGTAVSLGLRGTLTEEYADAGFTVSSNDITVPANGIYLVSGVFLLQETVDTGNPYAVGVKIERDTTNFLTLQANRWSATTSHTVHVSGSVAIDITDYATQVIRVTAGVTAGSSTTFAAPGNNNNKLSVVLLRRT